MTATKLTENNRRVSMAKTLAHTDKKSKLQKQNALKNQYKIIRSDVLKLRKDLAHGYDLLRNLIESKVSRKNT